MEKIKAKKYLGQNFLIDDVISQKIADFYELTGENIIEVGPGYGALTEKLTKKDIHSLQLVEFDRDMVEILEQRIQKGEIQMRGSTDIQVFQQDVLTFTPQLQEYLVIANIPYYITSPILFHFLYTVPHIPKKMLIMMQKEVGERILEHISPKPKNSLLSIAMWKKCNITQVCFVSKQSFSPAPKVDSIVLGFETKQDFSQIDDKKFILFLEKLFKEPRKTLVNNLVKGGYEKQDIYICISSFGYDEKIRAESLGVKQIVDIFVYLEEKKASI